MMGMLARAPAPKMGYPDAAPASQPQRQARARGRRTCHPRRLGLPRGPRTYCQSPWSPSGAVGQPPAAGVPTPRPAARVLGRPRALGSPRRAQMLPPRAPAAPPRAPWSPPPASLHPSQARSVLRPACPAHPAAASLPNTKQPATWPTPLQVPCPLYSPAAHLFSCLHSSNSPRPGASFQQGRP